MEVKGEGSLSLCHHVGAEAGLGLDIWGTQLQHKL